MIVLSASLGSIGCAQKRLHKPTWMWTESDAAKHVRTSLEAKHADDRRDAIAQLSQSRYADLPVVIKACALVAKTDPSEPVRAKAIRLLAESAQPQAVDTLVELLSEPNTTAPPGDHVRTAAVHGLYYLHRNGAIRPDREPEVMRVAKRLTNEDRSRDVRLAATLLLGRCRCIDSINALITCLDDRDFGVVYHAEQSLERLTGVSKGHDARKWRHWMASADNPLQGDGTLCNDTTSQRHWWQRMAQSVRRVFNNRKPANEAG